MTKPETISLGMKPTKYLKAIEALCLNCGLCCNGVLFGDVELQRADRSARLQALGFELFKKGRKRAFAQPCSCFNGSRCSIYPERPAHCAGFECGLLKRTQAGRITTSAALKTIAVAKRKVAKVESLLLPSGAEDGGASLRQRYSETMSAPLDLSVRRGLDHQGRLMESMHELMELLQAKFLQ